MGTIKFSAIVSDARGKIGGVVFSRNAAGAIARKFTKPVNPNTGRQQDVRNQFASLISSWRDLIPADQQVWADMAPQYPYTNAMGESSQYTGQALYNHLNMNLSVVGTTAIDTPLVPETFSAINLASVSLVLTAGLLTTANVVLSAVGLSTEAVIVEMTTSMSGGITKPAKSAFRQIQVFTNASTTATLDVETAYIALYGSPQLGAKVFIRAWLINKNTGQRLNLGQVVHVVTGT